MSQLTDQETEAALAQPPVKKKVMRKEDAEGLKEAFGITDEDIMNAMGGPAPPPQAGSEDLVKLLTEALRKAERRAAQRDE